MNPSSHRKSTRLMTSSISAIRLNDASFSTRVRTAYSTRSRNPSGIIKFDRISTTWRSSSSAAMKRSGHLLYPRERARQRYHALSFFLMNDGHADVVAFNQNLAAFLEVLARRFCRILPAAHPVPGRGLLAVALPVDRYRQIGYCCADFQMTQFRLLTQIANDCQLLIRHGKCSFRNDAVFA